MLFNRILFKLQVAFSKMILSRQKSIIAYPLLIDLTFNEEWYWDKFVNKKISVSNALFMKASMMNRRNNRHHHDIAHRAAMKRLERYKEYIEDSKFFNECNKKN